MQSKQCGTTFDWDLGKSHVFNTMQVKKHKPGLFHCFTSSIDVQPSLQPPLKGPIQPSLRWNHNERILVDSLPSMSLVLTVHRTEKGPFDGRGGSRRETDAEREAPRRPDSRSEARRKPSDRW